MNTGIVAFEREYSVWLEEHNRRVSEIREALQTHTSDIELQLLLDSCLKQYGNLLSIKADAAKADACYLISGVWQTSTERLFQWIGGFRPTKLLNVVMPYIQPLSDQQMLDVRTFQQTSQCAEEALSQGLDKCKKALAERIAMEMTYVESTDYKAAIVEDLQAVRGFVNQADHIRQQTLQHMNKILTTRQTAWGLLALGEYFQRLRALSDPEQAFP